MVNAEDVVASNIDASDISADTVDASEVNAGAVNVAVGYVPPKAIVEKNFRRGLWSDKMVNVALAKGAITKEDQVKIMGKAVENNSL